MTIYLVNQFRDKMKEALDFCVNGEEVYIKQMNNYFKIVIPLDSKEARNHYETNRRTKETKRRIESAGISTNKSMGKDKVTDSQ